ncbi:hypothetical protein [Nonomuraea indica]|uniref:hypothetical protein n=1 Tax=Nonomuraea indica TaxID=1581193 RepID=UPI000C7A4C8C|nr:hypothetical protein [Nonomuraea indica]
MSKRPPSLVAAALVVALEGLIALGLGGYGILETLRGAASDLTAGLAAGAFGLLVGAGLLWVAWGGLLKVERWGRAPGVLAQILLIPVAVTLIQSQQALPGGTLLVMAVVGLAALLAPPTTRALVGED